MDSNPELTQYAQRIELWMRQKHINLIDAHGDQGNFQYDWISGENGEHYRSVIAEKLPDQKPNEIMAEDFVVITGGHGMRHSIYHKICQSEVANYDTPPTLKQLNVAAVSHKDHCSAIQ